MLHAQHREALQHVLRGLIRQRLQIRQSGNDAAGRVRHFCKDGIHRLAVLHRFRVTRPSVALTAQFHVRGVIQARPQMDLRAHARHQIVAVQHVIQRIGRGLRHRTPLKGRGTGKAIAQQMMRQHTVLMQLMIRPHLHDRAALTVTAEPQHKAAVRLSSFLDDLPQGQLFQPQFLGRGWEKNLLLVALKLSSQLQKSLVDAFLAGHAKI